MTTGREFYAIVPTQFNSNGSLDDRATAHNIARAYDLGVSSFLLAGAYGEFQSLDDDERVRLVGTVRSLSPDIVLMTGAVHPSTHASCRLANRLLKAGATEVMVAAPVISEVTDPEILRHFEYLNKEVEGPLVLYNNPVFGHDIAPALIGRLVEFASFSAIKQGTLSSRTFLDSVAVAHSGPRRLRVLAASDVTGLITLSAGADGLTSTNFWAFPEALMALAAAAGTTEHVRAQSIHSAITPYFELVRYLGQPRAIKEAMLIRGFEGTAMVRLPYEPLSQGERQNLEDVMSVVDAALISIGLDLGVRAS